MLQVSAEHPAWRGDPLPAVPSGALVKVWPPSTASDEQVRRVVEAYRAAGAAGVRIALRPSLSVASRGGRERGSEPTQREGGKALRELVEGLSQSTATAAGVDPQTLTQRLLSALEKAGADRLADRSVGASAPVYVSALLLKNWRCFAGVHSLRLEPDVYAVLAHAEGEEGRSNWLGKTSLLEAIRFALWGSGARGQEGTEDGWITRGVEAGEVRIILSNDVIISRAGERGKRAKLLLIRPDGTEARGDLAQDEVKRIVGLTREDFDATVFLEQDETARLVTMPPGERYEVLAGWMPEIAVLRAAEELLESDLDKTRKEIDSADAAYRAAVVQAGSLLARVGIDAGLVRDEILKVLREKRSTAQEEVAATEKEADAAQRELQQAASEAGTAKAEAQAYERAKQRLERATPIPDAARIRDSLPAKRKAQEEARAALNLAEASAGRRRRVVASGFDGACPVAQGFACPAREQVEERVRTDAAAAREENARLTSLEADLQKATDALVEAGSVVAEDERRGREREHSQQEMDRTWGSWAKSHTMPDLAPMRAHVAVAWGRVNEAKARLKDLQCDVEIVFQAQDGAQESRSRAEGEERLLRAALAVVGRQGAQREVAAGALSEIEAGANDVLAESGIDLRVTLRWGRESEKRLVARCSGCWMLLPESTRVKVCPKCSTVRGPAIDDRVDVVLSDVSGGAKDLAGVALQLAAAGWLRARRGSAWGVLCVDEPFGALDVANRRGLGRHLATLLKQQHGVVQAFVVAHDAASLDALPGRVVIVRGRDGASRPEVDGNSCSRRDAT